MVAAELEHAGTEAGSGAITALCLVQFVDVLGVTVVVTALPDMLSDVHARPAAGTLVATGYAMFFGGLLMFGARLGDRLGHRRTILASLVVFAAGALLAALATSIVTLTAARCVQGAAAATAVPSALHLLTSLSPAGRARSRAVAAWSAAGAAAGASGFVVGGAVSDLTSWRYIFWGLVPVAATLGLGVARTVPADTDRAAPGSLNAAGSALLTGAVMAVVVGTTEVAEAPRRPLGLGLLGLAVVLAAALWAVDRRSREPLLPRRLLRCATLRRGAVAGFVNTATTSSAATLITLYLQNTLRRSPLAAAATLLPFSLAVVAGSAAAAGLAGRLAREHVAALGLALIAAGEGALLLTASHPVGIGGCTAAAGFGIGLSSVAATSLGTDVDDFDRATASGLINTTAQLGTALGVAAVLLVAAATTGVPAVHTGAPLVGWAVCAGAAAVSAVGFGGLGAHRRG